MKINYKKLREKKEEQAPQEELKNPEVTPVQEEVEKKVVNEEELLKAQEDLAELTKDLQRTRADFENYRKQIEAQKAQEKKIVKYATVSKVLPILDDMSRAIMNYEQLKPLEKTLEKTMSELGLARIPSEENVEFNPDLHEAAMVEGDGEKEVVAETLRPGYYYESEVLRPAMVKVKRIHEKAPQEGKEPQGDQKPQEPQKEAVQEESQAQQPEQGLQSSL